MTLVAVTCPTCGQTAGVPPSATVQATCNAHDQHKHRRGVTMIAANPDNKENES
jgi:hypothetical protein